MEANSSSVISSSLGLDNITARIYDLNRKIFNRYVIGRIPSNLRFPFGVKRRELNIGDLRRLMIGIDNRLVDIERNTPSIHVRTTRSHINCGTFIDGRKILHAIDANINNIVRLAIGWNGNVAK